MTDRQADDFNRSDAEKKYLLQKKKIYGMLLVDVIRNQKPYCWVAWELYHTLHFRECVSCLVADLTKWAKVIHETDHDYVYTYLKYYDWIKKEIGFNNLGLEG